MDTTVSDSALPESAKPHINIDGGKVRFPDLVKDTHYIDVLIKDKFREKPIPGILLREEGIQVLDNIRNALFSKPVDFTIPIDDALTLDEIVGKTIKIPASHAVQAYIEMLKRSKHATSSQVHHDLNAQFPGIVLQNKSDTSSIMLNSWDEVSPLFSIERKVMEFYYPDMTPVKDQYGLPLEKLAYPFGDPLTIGPQVDISHNMLIKK